jgi:hypothetical protein
LRDQSSWNAGTGQAIAELVDQALLRADEKEVEVLLLLARSGRKAIRQARQRVQASTCSAEIKQMGNEVRSAFCSRSSTSGNGGRVSSSDVLAIATADLDALRCQGGARLR